MKKQLSIKELIDCKYGQFAEKDAFLMFIQDECEVRGINAEGTIRYIQYAKKKFEHQEAWEALIKEKDASEELNADATLEQFLGEITRVHVQFKTDDGATFDYPFLNDGLETIEVSSVEEIQNAVSNRKGVKLIQDLISYNDLEIEVPGSAMIIIDLNGHSLKAKSFVFKTFSGGTNIFSSNGYGLIWTSIQSKQTSLNQLVDSDGLSPNFGDYVKLKTYPYEAPIHSGGTEN